MKAHIQKQDPGEYYVIRIFDDGKKYGDAFEWSCFVIVNGEKAKIIGVDKPVKMEYRRLIREKLHEIGVNEAYWERHSNGEIKQIRVK